MEVHAENIKKEFLRKSKGSNVFEAVKSCNFELSKGCLSVIKGRSGGGKSTLLNMLSGILEPTEGKIFYDDTDIYALGDEKLSVFRNENIGFIPQGRSSVASLNVFENILLPNILYGKKNEERALELMEEFGILDLKDVYPKELSGGELRRMAIARSLINSPKVLFADEPTGDLDDENTKVVFEALKKIAHNGCAVLMVTHEEGAQKYADRIFRMDAGVLNVG